MAQFDGAMESCICGVCDISTSLIPEKRTLLSERRNLKEAACDSADPRGDRKIEIAGVEDAADGEMFTLGTVRSARISLEDVDCSDIRDVRAQSGVIRGKDCPAIGVRVVVRRSILGEEMLPHIWTNNRTKHFPHINIKHRTRTPMAPIT
jgi:hypothetical protein